MVYSRANAHARAAQVFRCAIELMPKRASYRFNLATSLTFCGEIDAAEAECEACLALEPRHWRAHSALSQLRKQTPQHNHIMRLQQLLPAAQEQPDALLTCTTQLPRSTKTSASTRRPSNTCAPASRHGVR